MQGDNEMVEQEFMLSDILHGEDEEEEEEETLTGEYNSRPPFQLIHRIKAILCYEEEGPTYYE